MATFRGVLLDLDGVLYVDGRPLPGAREALARLRASGRPLRFITNTTRKCRRVILEQLAAMALAVLDNELFTPARAADDWLRQQRRSPHLLIHPGLKEDFAGFAGDGMDAVVVGDAGDGFTYAALNRAFRILLTGVPLLALATNRYFREADGLSLDAGPFVSALQHASGANALLFGKPAAGFYRAAIAGMACQADEVVMIGDDVEADVNGAIEAGLAAILVKTGKYRAGDEYRVKPGAIVTDDVAAAVDCLLNS